ncbi:MAG: tetratricopeptide repeat protein, partial [Terriglobales bacterium]
MELRLDRAAQDRDNGKTREALALLNPILEQHPQNFRSLYMKGLLLADQQDFEQAEGFLTKALQVHTQCISTPRFKPDFTVYNALGWVQLARGESPQAETNFNEALKHSDKLTPAAVARTKNNLGYLYFTTGDFDKSKSVLKEAADAGNADAVANLKAVDQAQTIYQDGAVNQMRSALAGTSSQDRMLAQQAFARSVGTEIPPQVWIAIKT